MGENLWGEKARMGAFLQLLGDFNEMWGENFFVGEVRVKESEWVTAVSLVMGGDRRSPSERRVGVGEGFKKL